MKSMGKVFILGDSYSTFEGAIPEEFVSYYGKEIHPETNVYDVSQTWWHMFLKETGSDLMLNSSYSGTTVCHTGYAGKDCRETSFVARFDKLVKAGYFKNNKPDTFIVFGGTNDAWANSPVGELKYSEWTDEDLYSSLPAYCCLLHRISEVLPETKVICIINDDRKPEIQQGYAKACEKYGIQSIQLNAFDKVEGHPTKTGMEQIKDQIISKLY